MHMARRRRRKTERHGFKPRLVLAHEPKKLGTLFTIARDHFVRVFADPRIAVGQETLDERALPPRDREPEAERSIDVPDGLPIRELRRA